MNIGMTETDRKKVAEGLAKLLADSYTLYLKTHNFHWNVTGPLFGPLHTMFETQYTELSLAVDTIAERIRALGFRAPGSYKEYSKLTSIKEEDGSLNANEMVKQLVEAQEAVIRTARALLPDAEKAVDEATVDLCVERLQIHEKNAWMLRSILEGGKDQL